ncbi:MAG: DUF2281 domain-containing protein [Saprospiraceae bacterium]|nr:DUF2281 domain-containing protein [Saprospiraceae bacterium]
MKIIKMITVSTKAHISASQPYVVVKGVPEGMYDIIVVLQPQQTDGEDKKPRKAGFSKATFEMSANFNEPLEDFKEYM